MLTKSVLKARKLIKTINIYHLLVVTYSFGNLKWNNSVQEEIQRSTSSMLTHSNNHHPKSSTLRAILPKREGERGLFNIGKAKSSELHSVILMSDRNYSPLNQTTISNLVANNTLINDPQDNILINYFSRIGPHLAQDLAPAAKPLNNISQGNFKGSILYLEITTPEEIESITSDLEQNTAPGIDNMSVHYLFPVISQIFEACVNKRLIEYLNLAKFWYQQQYVFRQGSSSK